METNEKLAGTLNWLVANGHIPGLLPENVTAAADRLIEQGKRIAELEATLAANKHTASAEIVDGPAPYSKELRVRVDIVDPRPYYAMHYVDTRRLVDGGDDFVSYVAQHSMRMASRAFEEALMPQAMRAVHHAVAELKKLTA